MEFVLHRKSVAPVLGSIIEEADLYGVESFSLIIKASFFTERKRRRVKIEEFRYSSNCEG
jgi:hypothetical protein